MNTTPSYTVTGLNADTKYDSYVIAVCGINDLSVKVGPISTRTLCSSTTVPYTMDFENITPPAIDFCTSIENVGSGNNWATVFNGINGFSSKVLRYGFSTSANANAWFYTQGIQLTAGTDYVISYKYGNDSPIYTEKMNVAYGTSASAAGMNTIISQHFGITGGQASTETVTFTAATTDVYYFGFNAFSVANQNELFLDDINIYLAPSCSAPSALSASNFTTTSADLSWTAGGTETEWNVIYGDKGFDPTINGTTVNVTGTSQTTITGLNAGTEYDYYVIAVCSPTDESILVGPFEFGTACGNATVPYLEDFESATIPALPICTSGENAGSGNDWKTLYYFNHGFTGFVLNYSYSSISAANAWFYTQGITLEAGVQYEISYTYGNAAGYPEKRM